MHIRLNLPIKFTRDCATMHLIGGIKLSFNIFATTLGNNVVYLNNNAVTTRRVRGGWGGGKRSV